MNIRTATFNDLEQISKVEAQCFPAAEAATKEEGEEQAKFFKFTVFPAMEALRAPVDKLEMIVDKEAWPMPSYGDLMFEV